MRDTTRAWTPSVSPPSRPTSSTTAHSPEPRGRRFDDILAAVPNLAAENNLALVNLAVSLLEPGESYVEAGTYMGASLIAAARDNEGKDLVAVDNFSLVLWSSTTARSYPRAARSWRGIWRASALGAR